VLGEISVDGGLQVGDRAKDAAADALAGHFGKEVLDRVGWEIAGVYVGYIFATYMTNDG